jgi:hypothetical protein
MQANVANSARLAGSPVISPTNVQSALRAATDGVMRIRYMPMSPHQSNMGELSLGGFIGLVVLFVVALTAATGAIDVHRRRKAGRPLPCWYTRCTAERVCAWACQRCCAAGCYCRAWYWGDEPPQSPPVVMPQDTAQAAQLLVERARLWQATVALVQDTVAEPQVGGQVGTTIGHAVAGVWQGTQTSGAVVCAPRWSHRRYAMH